MSFCILGADKPTCPIRQLVQLVVAAHHSSRSQTLPLCLPKYQFASGQKRVKWQATALPSSSYMTHCKSLESNHASHGPIPVERARWDCRAVGKHQRFCGRLHLFVMAKKDSS